MFVCSQCVFLYHLQPLAWHCWMKMPKLHLWLRLRWMVWWNPWLPFLWWAHSCFRRGSGWRQQAERDWQSCSGAHFTDSISHRAPSPHRPLWRWETNIIMKGGGSGTSHEECFNSFSHLNKNLEQASLWSQTCLEARASTGCYKSTCFYQTIFLWNVIVLQMSNTSSEMLSKASLFSARAAHSHEFSKLQSACWHIFVSLVWFPLHQGGGPKLGNTVWTGPGSAWKPAIQ